jgi:hypothetical protein
MALKAYLVVWECHCSEARTRAEDLPAVCPEHKRVPIVGHDGLGHALIEPVAGHTLVLGHECETAA